MIFFIVDVVDFVDKYSMAVYLFGVLKLSIFLTEIE